METAVDCHDRKASLALALAMAAQAAGMIYLLFLISGG
jgi:hypothetical protein